MKTILILTCTLALASGFAPSASAQIHLSGPLSGTLAAGEYIVDNHISVNQGQSLTIAAGAHLRFAGHYKFNIYGLLRALGSEQDSILFTHLSSDSTWWSIHFYDSASDSGILQYCRIEYGEATGSYPEGQGGGLNIRLADPTIAHCTLNNNTASGSGGAIYCDSSNVTITDCNIVDNAGGFVAGIFIARNSTAVMIANCFISRNTSQYSSGGAIGCHIATNVQIINCTITDNVSLDGCAGIRSYQTDMVISNCRVSGNQSGGSGGGGISVTSAIISDCVVSDNSLTGLPDSYGGGIYCYEATITNCLISGNSCTYGMGGGIFCASDACQINNCQILNNHSDQRGGGVCGWQGDNFTSTNCTISGNTADEMGGGVFGDGILDHCVITDNTAGLAGGGVHTEMYAPSITNCTINHNSAGQGGNLDLCWSYGGMILEGNIFSFANYGSGIYFQNPSGIEVRYCDFFGNGGGDFSGVPPAMLGQVVMTNLNDDSCDVFSNIYLNPQFVDTSAGDFHLQAASPCIDASDPLSPRDPDWTLADIGAFYFDQSTPVAILLTPLDPPVTIPANGGSFQFDLEIANTDSVMRTVDVWTMITLPYGAQFPILNRSGISLPAGGHIVRPNLTQFVPGSAAPGPYIYTAYVRDHNTWASLDEDSFPFQKLYGQGDAAADALGWALLGWEDESAAAPSPTEFALNGNYPNPFNPMTVIRYALPEAGRVKLEIFDLAGRSVGRLVNGMRTAGYHQVTWDASKLPSGIYFYRLQVGSFTAVKKMMLVK